VNLLYIVLGTTTAVQLATACSSQGYTPTYLANDGTLTYSWRTAPALDGALVAEATFPFFDDSIPATQEAQDALKKYAPGVIDSSVYGGHVSEVWSAGQMFAAAATAGHVGPTSTSSQVKTGLYDLHNETLDGLIPPITYTKGQGTQAKCYYIISVENGKFTEPNGLHYSCQP
jgi:branched-chain amino acid transport system substrate-binding protein